MARWKILFVAIVAITAFAVVGCASQAASSSSAASSGSSTSSSASSSSVASSSASSGTSSNASPSAAPVEGVLPESEWGDLFATIGDDAVTFGQRVQTELPVKAYACWQGEGGGDPLWYEDPADIQALFNALASSGIAGEATTITTDDYTSFGFEFADGTKFGVMLDSMALQVQEGNSWKFYEVSPSPALASYAKQAMDHTMEKDK